MCNTIAIILARDSQPPYSVKSMNYGEHLKQFGDCMKTQLAQQTQVSQNEPIPHQAAEPTQPDSSRHWTPTQIHTNQLTQSKQDMRSPLNHEFSRAIAEQAIEEGQNIPGTNLTMGKRADSVIETALQPIFMTGSKGAKISLKVVVPYRALTHIATAKNRLQQVQQHFNQPNFETWLKLNLTRIQENKAPWVCHTCTGSQRRLITIFEPESGAPNTDKTAQASRLVFSPENPATLITAYPVLSEADWNSFEQSASKSLIEFQTGHGFTALPPSMQQALCLPPTEELSHNLITSLSLKEAPVNPSAHSSELDNSTELEEVTTVQPSIKTPDPNIVFLTSLSELEVELNEFRMQNKEAGEAIHQVLFAKLPAPTASTPETEFYDAFLRRLSKYGNQVNKLISEIIGQELPLIEKITSLTTYVNGLPRKSNDKTTKLRLLEHYNAHLAWTRLNNACYVKNWLQLAMPFTTGILHVLEHLPRIAVLAQQSFQLSNNPETNELLRRSGHGLEASKLFCTTMERFLTELDVSLLDITPYTRDNLASLLENAQAEIANKNSIGPACNALGLAVTQISNEITRMIHPPLTHFKAQLSFASREFNAGPISEQKRQEQKKSLITTAINTSMALNILQAVRETNLQTKTVEQRRLKVKGSQKAREIAQSAHANLEAKPIAMQANKTKGQTK